MKILIIAATPFEVKPLFDFLEITGEKTEGSVLQKTINDVDISVLITGVGMVNTAYALGKHIHNRYDIAINAGVCGAFDKKINLGELVYVTQDVLSEMGAEDGDTFITYDALNLPGKHQFSAVLKTDFKVISTLKRVKGITVNTIHGNETTIEQIKKRYHPDVESMEGAAFYAFGSQLAKNSIQIRAVSNYVEKRDKSKWKMELAITNLNTFLIDFINHL